LPENRDKKIVVDRAGRVKQPKKGLKATVEAKPKPQEPDDPRPAHIRNAPGGYG